ncbi:UNVERIFIED_ORG: hypothetical protein BTE55_09830 [Rhizobium sophorae]
MLENRAPESLSLDGVVRFWAERRPGATALSYADNSEPGMDWRAFEQHIAHVAAMLEPEIEFGQPVGVVCADSAAFHVLVNALWRLGAGVVLIDRNWGPAIVSDLIRLVDCHRIYAPNTWQALGDAQAQILPFPHFPHFDTARCNFPKLKRPLPRHDTTALYATTSGTTDNPKCVAVTHGRIRSAYRVCLDARDLTQVSRAACLFEINSLGILGVCFLLPREIGAETKVYRSFSLSTISDTWGRVFEDGIDFVYLVPALVRLVRSVRLPTRPSRRVLAFCSAAPVTEGELRTLEARFEIEAYNIYGLTELSFAVFFGERSSNGGPSDSIGRAIGIEARLIDAVGADVKGPGRGELLIRGPMLSDGYLHNADATRRCWDAGWLRSGDLAERDEAERYFIRGRLKDVVLRGGYTYYLGELEHYLRRAPGVIDVCAFRGRDLPSGDELCVVAQVDRSVASADLFAWIEANMGRTKLPNSLCIWKRALPRNSNGKIQRSVLVDLHLSGQLVSESLE